MSRLIDTAIEVLRGGKPGLVHWVPRGQAYEGDELESLTSCGVNPEGMIRQESRLAMTLTCEECQEALVVDTLRREEEDDHTIASGAHLDRLAYDRFGTQRLPRETDAALRNRIRSAFDARAKTGR